MFDSLSEQEKRLWRDILNGNEEAVKAAKALGARGGYSRKVPFAPAFFAKFERVLGAYDASGLYDVAEWAVDAKIMFEEVRAKAIRVSQALHFFVPKHSWISTRTGSCWHAAYSQKHGARGRSVSVLCGRAYEVDRSVGPETPLDELAMCSHCYPVYRKHRMVIERTYSPDTVRGIIYHGDPAHFLNLAA